MIYCILSFLFYAILACFLHIGRLLDGSSVLHVILLGLLKNKKMIKIDSANNCIQRQICRFQCVSFLKNRKRRVFSKSSLLTRYCAGHQSPDRYQDPEMETENGTPAADVVHPLQTAAFLVNSTINNQVNVNFTASQPDIPMTNLYYQCRAERTSSFRNNAIELGGCASFGFEVGGEKHRIGSFEFKNIESEKCYLGSRICKGTSQVNQNICLSFDPVTRTCLTCESNHGVTGNPSGCFILSDQNFVANLSGAAGAGTCIGVIRLEDSSLDELADILCELFDRAALPAGTAVCVGSGSHLHRVGATIYAQDWNKCNAKLSARFPGFKICPLIPLPREDCPAALASDLSILACWFARMYNSGTVGLIDCWAKLAHSLASQTPADESSFTAYSTLALPVSLAPNAQLAPSRFALSSSRCGKDVPLDAKATSELLRALLTALSSQLMVDCNPGESPVRITANQQSGKDFSRTVVVIGASNMRRCLPILGSLGYETVDLTHIGWDGSDAAVARVRGELDKLKELKNATYVLDLLTCNSYRFVQADGGLALPVKLGARFHLLGDVALCDDKMLKTAITKLLPLLSSIDGPKVILPPLPRFVAGGCCGEASHARNTEQDGHGEKMLQGIMHLRKIVRDELVSSSLTGYWVADPVAALLDSDLLRPVSATELSHFLGGDNVHFTPLGYTKLVAGITNCFEKAVKKLSQSAASYSVSGSSGAPSKFYWRGFISTHGAVRTGFKYGHRNHGGSDYNKRPRSHPYRGAK